MKPSVEFFFQLDIRAMSKAFNVNGSGEWFTWSCPYTGSSVRFFDKTERLLRLEYWSRDQRYTYEIGISRTKCHLGGSRAWMHCRSCSRRVAILYINGPTKCRDCWDAAYPVQSEAWDTRLWRRARKLRARLGVDTTTIPAYLLPRPKGMHWETYEELTKEIHLLEKTAWEYQPPWLLKLEADIARETSLNST